MIGFPGQRRCYDPGSALLIATALGATGGSIAYQQSESKKNKAKANAAADDADAKARAASQAEAAEEAKTAKARASLLAEPTAGFGPNKNLARSFLTTF